VKTDELKAAWAKADAFISECHGPTGDMGDAIAAFTCLRELMDAAPGAIAEVDAQRLCAETAIKQGAEIGRAYLEMSAKAERLEGELAAIKAHVGNVHGVHSYLSGKGAVIQPDKLGDLLVLLRSK
jgi:hypothetical protein